MNEPIPIQYEITAEGPREVRFYGTPVNILKCDNHENVYYGTFPKSIDPDNDVDTIVLYWDATSNRWDAVTIDSAEQTIDQAIQQSILPNTEC